MARGPWGRGPLTLGEGQTDVRVQVLTWAKREGGREVGVAAFCTACACPAASLGKLAMEPSYEPASPPDPISCRHANVML